MNINESSQKKFMGAGVLAAVGASLCCITPLLALISGASGIAAAFSWMEPFRPYLIAITIAVLGFAWHHKLKPKTNLEPGCACDENELRGGETGKPSFLQSKRFLSFVTAFAVLMLAFPYYGKTFYPKTSQKASVSADIRVQEIRYRVSGMTCSACEAHISHAVNQLPGIVQVEADYKSGITSIKYDPTQSDETVIMKAIDATGYKAGEPVGSQNSTPN